MRLAVGVRIADPVFVTVVVHFQVVGHLLAALAITQHGHVWRMVKANLPLPDYGRVARDSGATGTIAKITGRTTKGFG